MGSVRRRLAELLPSTPAGADILFLGGGDMLFYPLCSALAATNAPGPRKDYSGGAAATTLPHSKDRASILTILTPKPNPQKNKPIFATAGTKSKKLLLAHGQGTISAKNEQGPGAVSWSLSAIGHDTTNFRGRI